MTKREFRRLRDAVARRVEENLERRARRERYFREREIALRGEVRR